MLKEVAPWAGLDEALFYRSAARRLMTLERRAMALVAALIAALAIQVPMFPGTGLETRDPTTFAPWFQSVSILLFPALMVTAVVALALASRRLVVSAYLSVTFAAGMIAVTILDVTGLGGVAPPATIVALELGALVTLIITLALALRALRRPIGEPSAASVGPPSVAS